MRPDSTPIELHLPPLCDEAVVEIQDFLTEVLQLFESHYGDQIHRFYEDRSFHNLVHPTPRTGPPEDPPF
jgi:hypothetical protein